MSRDLLLSFVLTPYFGLPPPDDLLREWRGIHGRAPKDARRETNGIVCEAGNLRVTIAPNRGVIPGSEVEDGTQLSAARFLDANKPVKYGSHLAVASSAAKLTLAELELHVTLLAALAKTLDAGAVYSSPATHPASYFIETAEQRKPLTPLWCSVGYAKAADKPGYVSYLSHGLAQLGLLEVELVCAEAIAKDGFSRLLDVAGHVAKLGRNLEPGETFGAAGTTEKFPVTHVASPLDANQRVCRVEI